MQLVSAKIAKKFVVTAIFIFSIMAPLGIGIGFLVRFKLTPSLAGLNSAYAGEWSLWKSFNFNLPNWDLFMNFLPRLTLNKQDKNFFAKFSLKFSSSIALVKRYKNKIQDNKKNTILIQYFYKQWSSQRPPPALELKFYYHF